MIIITGSQGSGKTWWVNHMMPKALRRYFTKYTIKKEVDDLEVKIKMSTCLLVLDDEGGYMDDTSTAAMKDILSSRYIMARPLYSNVVSSRPKIASFIMTSNFKDHLRDETGNRRFVVVDTDTADERGFSSISRSPTDKELQDEDTDRELMVVEALRAIAEGFDFQLSSNEVDFINSQMIDNHVEGVEHSFVESFFKISEGIDDRKVVSVLELENYARDKIKGTFNRKMLKVAMYAKGFKRQSHRIKKPDKTVKGYSISLSSRIFNTYDIS